MIVHDQDRKDRGEPCKQFLQLAEAQPPVEIVSIHCKRAGRTLAALIAASTLRTSRKPSGRGTHSRPEGVVRLGS
jgi:hypothetical protein